MITDIEFQIISWEARDELEENDDDDEDSQEGKNKKYNASYVIELFGRTKDEQTVYLKVTDFKPFFYIELDEKWRQCDIEILVNEMRKKVGKKFSHTLFKYELIKRNKFKEFNNYKEFPFLRLIFTCYEGLKKYKYMMNRGILLRNLSTKPIKIEQYESNLEPFLRCMHIRELNSCGWITAKSCLKLPKTISCCNINLKTKWNNLDPIKDDKSISKVTILAYDIECYSADGSFPNAKKDIISMIGSTFSKYGEPNCYYKNIIVYGTCDPIEGVDVIEVHSEEKLLLEWTKLVKRMNPDILLTHNGFDFDNRYMYNRAKNLGIEKKFMKLSRITDMGCKFVEQKLASAALGQNINYFPSFDGRVQLDIMKYVLGIEKIDSYSLDFLASHYIREAILDIEDGIKIKTKKTFGLEIGRYIAINFNDGLSDNRYGNNLKFKVVSLTDTEIIIDNVIDKTKLDFKNCKVFWCQTKDDVKPQDIFDSFTGTSQQRQLIAKYCIQDCCLLNTLMAKLNVVSNNMGMANVCHVPLSYIFMRGQGIKIFSLVAERCRIRNHLIPVTDKNADIDVDFEDPENQETSVIMDQIRDIKIVDGCKMTFSSKYVELIRSGKRIDIYARKKDSKDYIKIHNDQILISKCTKKTFTIDTMLEMDIDDNDYFWVYEDNSYEGATVFVPSTGIHRQPVAVLDYKSLYPSAMIMNNMSPECCISGEVPDLSDYDKFQVEAKIGANKIKTLTFVRPKNGKKIGILAEILQDLLKARSDTRKLIPLQKDPFMAAVFDGLQLAYKTVANSLYGQTGSKVSAIHKKEIAAATTATGRDMLLFAKDFVENKIPLISDVLEEDVGNKEAFYEVMNQIFEECNEPRFRDFFCLLFTNPKKLKKPDTKILEYRKKLKLQKTDRLELLTEEFKENYENGEYNIKTIKRIFYDEMRDDVLKILDNMELTTHPKVVYGDSVIGTTPVLLRDYNGKIFVKNIEDINQTWQKYKYFKFNDKDLTNKEHNNQINLEVWTEQGWSQIKRIIRHNTNKEIVKVETQGDIVIVTEDHSLITINDRKYDVLTYAKPNSLKLGTKLLTSFPPGNFLDLPENIINMTVKEKVLYINKYYGNIHNYLFHDTLQTTFDLLFKNKTYIEVMEVYIMLSSMGFVDLNITENNTIIILSNRHKFCSNKIKKITNLGKLNDYVYDLETNTGHFHAGLGKLIVKNTDSVFFSPYFKDKTTGQIITTKRALEKAIQLGDFASQMTFMILRDPMELEYEKTFWPLCLLKKKKYVGNLYEHNSDKYYQKSMGIVLKRRDNAPIVKIVCGAIVRELLNNTAQGAVEYTKKLLNDIVNNKIPLEKYIITKTLKETYKDRSKIAHAVLADRIYKRTGNKLASNTRMSYIYFYCRENDELNTNVRGELKKVKRNKDLLQGDKIEDIEYMIANNLKVDTLFYLTNQILKPACQFLELAVENCEKIFMHYITREINRRKGKKNILNYNIYEKDSPDGYSCDTGEYKEADSDEEMESDN